jgi:hypothetical protein
MSSLECFYYWQIKLSYKAGHKIKKIKKGYTEDKIVEDMFYNFSIMARFIQISKMVPYCKPFFI